VIRIVAPTYLFYFAKYNDEIYTTAPLLNTYEISVAVNVCLRSFDFEIQNQEMFRMKSIKIIYMIVASHL